jgi:hypothetical protein
MKISLGLLIGSELKAFTGAQSKLSSTQASGLQYHTVVFYNYPDYWSLLHLKGA